MIECDEGSEENEDVEVTEEETEETEAPETTEAPAEVITDETFEDPPLESADTQQEDY